MKIEVEFSLSERATKYLNFLNASGLPITEEELFKMFVKGDRKSIVLGDGDIHNMLLIKALIKEGEVVDY